MADEWMPGATRYHRRDDGGAMAGGPPRVVWHTTEGGESARQFRNMQYPSHLVWQPTTGEIVQLIPANRAGRALENRGGGVETNRMGRCCIQIEVVGRAARPFTGTSMRGLDKILAWLDSWDIPRTFPAGAPGGSNMYGPNPQRNSATWRTRAGHFGHSQVPENAHWDPGQIDIGKLLGAALSGEEDDMPEYVHVTGKATAVPPGVWRTVSVDSSGWENGPFEHVLDGPARVDGYARVECQAADGTQVQLRWAENTDGSDRLLEAHPWAEGVAAGGATPVFCPVMGDLQDGRDLAIQVKHWGESALDMDVTARVYYWDR